MTASVPEQQSGSIEESDETAAGETLTRDDAFELISNQRRRHTLHYLKQNGEDATLGEIAEQIAAWENGTTVDEVSSSERKTVYTALQQFHLPKLDNNDVVEFDNRSGEVRVTEAAAELDIYLDVVDEYGIPWSGYYLGLTLIGSILVSLSWLGVAPFAAVPFVAWTTFLLGAFLVSSLSHVFISRSMRLGSDSKPPEVTENDA